MRVFRVKIEKMEREKEKEKIWEEWVIRIKITVLRSLQLLKLEINEKTRRRRKISKRLQPRLNATAVSPRSSFDGLLILHRTLLHLQKSALVEASHHNVVVLSLYLPSHRSNAEQSNLLPIQLSALSIVLSVSDKVKTNLNLHARSTNYLIYGTARTTTAKRRG